MSRRSAAADAGTVRFAGQDAAVAAGSAPDRRGCPARLVAVSYREKPFAHELRAAMKKDAALVFAEAETRRQGRDDDVAGPHRQRTGPGSSAATWRKASRRLTPSSRGHPPCPFTVLLETHGSWPPGRATS